jgi:serine/threonine protein phosphatase 1
MTRLYAIGDIHGHLDKLARAHRLIAADREITGDQDAPVVHLGDLVDRGPESAEVVDYLAQGPARGGPWITLLGNHDRMFARFVADATAQDAGMKAEYDWLHPKIGGLATLESYGVSPAPDLASLHRQAQARVPAHHRAFLAELPLFFVAGPLFLVHAGIRPGVPLNAQVEDDLLWIRSPFLTDQRDHGALIVHGHTAIRAAEHHGNRVNLDTGAGFDRALSVAVFEGRDVALLTDQGRQPLPPP